MNWGPGLIVGTVKPVASVGGAQELRDEPQIQPGRNAATAVSAIPISVNQNINSKLQGTVQSLPPGSDKIQGTVKVVGSDEPIEYADLLKQQAIQEIHRDIKISRIRADQVGALGWKSCPLKKTNKRFLNRTMKSVIQHNNRQTIRAFHSSTRKLIEMDREDDVRHRHRKRSESTPKPSSKVQSVIDDDNDELEEGELRDSDDSNGSN